MLIVVPMNFIHLKAFYNVAKYKSFTLAACKLNVSQSTLSLQVQDLERQYDIPLLKRTKKTVELTDEGKIVFSYAKRIFSLAHEMEETIEDLDRTQSGKLKIGSTPLLARYMLPNIILALKKSNPELRIQLDTGLSGEILNKVIDFEYHVGLIGRVSYPGNVIYRQISKQKLHLITVDSIDDQLCLKDLSNYPLILREEGSATREYIINEFAKRNIPLNNYIESQNPDAIKRMVHFGMGGAFFPSYSIEEDVQEGRFRKIEIVDDIYLYVDVIYLLERKKLKNVRSFVSVVSEYSF
jgi:DNA-binding transcriptional LysR family regulator